MKFLLNSSWPSRKASAKTSMQYFPCSTRAVWITPCDRFTVPLTPCLVKLLMLPTLPDKSSPAAPWVKRDAKYFNFSPATRLRRGGFYRQIRCSGWMRKTLLKIGPDIRRSSVGQASWVIAGPHLQEHVESDKSNTSCRSLSICCWCGRALSVVCLRLRVCNRATVNLRRRRRDGGLVFRVLSCCGRTCCRSTPVADHPRSASTIWLPS